MQFLIANVINMVDIVDVYCIMRAVNCCFLIFLYDFVLDFLFCM
jgi:hypothetical protein